MYRYNKDAKYSVGSYNPKTLAADTLDIAVSQTESFKVKVLNPLTKYLNPPIKSDILTREQPFTAGLTEIELVDGHNPITDERSGAQYDPHKVDITDNY